MTFLSLPISKPSSPQSTFTRWAAELRRKRFLSLKKEVFEVEDQDLIRYDGQHWVPKSLTEVLPTAVSGDLLQFDGTNWNAKDLTEILPAATAWSPTFTAVGGGSLTSDTATWADYVDQIHLVHIEFRVSPSVTGTVSSITATVPTGFDPTNNGAPLAGYYQVGSVYDPLIVTTTGSNTVVFFPFDGVNFAAGTNHIYVGGSYRY